MSNTPENKEPLPGWFTRLMGWSLSVLLVPIVYLFGVSYDHGYLHAYGVSGEFFSRDFQEYLVKSYYGLLSLMGFLLHWIDTNGVVVGFVVFAGTALGLLFISLMKRLPVERTMEWGRRIPWIVKSVKLLHIPALAGVAAWSIPSTIFFWAVVFLLIPYTFYVRGDEEAVKEMGRAKPCVYATKAPGECVFLFDSGKLVGAGIVVARSPGHLALFNEGRTKIYPVKDQVAEAVPPSSKP